MIKPHTLVYKVQYVQRVINHRPKDVQYEYIGDEERIQDEYINDEKEERNNIELLMECTRMMCGKYQT